MTEMTDAPMTEADRLLYTELFNEAARMTLPPTDASEHSNLCFDEGAQKIANYRRECVRDIVLKITNFRQQALEDKMAEVEKLQTQLRHFMDDYLDDELMIKEMAKKFGIDTVGDSYGVPGIVDCVVKMESMLIEALKKVSAAEDREEHLRLDLLQIGSDE